MQGEQRSLLDSLRAAVAAAPDDVALRLHLAELLMDQGERDEAVRQAAVILQSDPANSVALGLIRGEAPARDEVEILGSRRTPASDDDALRQLGAAVDRIVPAPFIEAGGSERPLAETERVELCLADVAGMAEVKARLEAAFLAPIRNPALVEIYGKSLRGGLLLYGPPGCGKTFIARALAGEMGARFITVSLADVLDMWVGQSERNMHEIFESARRNSPCIIFLDEVDALGGKRSQLRNTGSRGTVNQLLTEMDGLRSAKQGVYVLGATNHPWDVDVALLRPGRFDRMVFVAPPDAPAREAVLRFHLHHRPVEQINLGKFAQETKGFSGADLAYVCERAAEQALIDSAGSGNIRIIGMDDLDRARRDVKPSIGPWLDIARNVVEFSNTSGAYDDLADYLRARRRR